MAAPALAGAQQTARPDPADPAATAPAPAYDSVFKTYVPQREVMPAAWKDINDEAARIGGHVGSIRQSGLPGAAPGGKSRAESASPSTVPSPAMPAMPGHGAGH
jgi:hypothetical protein